MLNAAPILAAEISKAPKRGPMAGPAYWLDFNIIANGERRHVETIAVSGKAEARKIAKARVATPWNF